MATEAECPSCGGATTGTGKCTQCRRFDAMLWFGGGVLLLGLVVLFWLLFGVVALIVVLGVMALVAVFLVGM